MFGFRSKVLTLDDNNWSLDHDRGVVETTVAADAQSQQKISYCRGVCYAVPSIPGKSET